jgi:hypothetical protein
MSDDDDFEPPSPDDIRELMRELELNQGEFAARIGVSPTYLSHFMNHKAHGRSARARGEAVRQGPREAVCVVAVDERHQQEGAEPAPQDQVLHRSLLPPVSSTSPILQTAALPNRPTYVPPLRPQGKARGNPLQLRAGGAG